MKKFVLFLLTAAMLALSIAGLSGCKTDDNVLIVGYTEYEPMNYKDENGKLIGFDTEFAEAVAAKLGMEIRFQLISWDMKYVELQSGTVNCLWNGFTANCADTDGIMRSDKVDFSYAYMGNAQCVVVKSADLSRYTSESSLSGKSCAVESNSAGDSYVSSLGNVTVNGQTAQTDCLLEVLSGASDFAVIDLLMANSMVGKGDYASLAKVTAIEIETEEYAVGFKKGSPLVAKVNAAMAEMSADGTLRALAEKYGIANQLIPSIGSND